MNTEPVLGAIVAKVTEILKQVVNQVAVQSERPTLYDLEEQTQAVLAPIGQALLHGLVNAQGAGGVGAERPCGCGEVQNYHDQARPLSVQTSVGSIHLSRRASYHCASCQANGYPLDEQLGLGQAGRMSRSLQEQCGWLLALLPAGVAQQTLGRFGWPAVAASQVREHGEALGREREQQIQERLTQARREAAAEPTRQRPRRHVPMGERLYAAPDGLMYCTTERDAQTGKVRWRELKVAAVYEATAAQEVEAEQAEASDGATSAAQEPVRTRVARWLRAQEPPRLAAPADRAIRISSVAETGPWEQFGPRLWGEVWERGLGRAGEELVVVADGSDHIDQVVDSELRLPGIHLTRILDIAHAQHHLWAVSTAAFGEGKAAGAAWVQAPLRALERGQVGVVLRHLEVLATAREARLPEVAEGARKAAGYFRQRQTQVNYPQFVAAG